jgi:hypothetical protein
MHPKPVIPEHSMIEEEQKIAERIEDDENGQCERP